MIVDFDFGGGLVTTRVTVDTNLWSSIGGDDVVLEFQQLMASHGLKVLMPPSMLVEVARISRTDSR